MEDLRRLYRERVGEIKNRLKDFELAGYRPEKQIFEELCFCLLTPGTSAFSADLALKELAEKGLLFEGGLEEVAEVLKGKVRFHNNKARNIVQARGLLGGRLLEIIRAEPAKAREFLTEGVRGLGWKEASHFLRNIGKGKELAIVDRHVLKNLKAEGMICEIPKSITAKKYLELEGCMKVFAEKMGIPMDELDLLIWSKETGRVFK